MKVIKYFCGLCNEEVDVRDIVPLQIEDRTANKASTDFPFINDLCRSCSQRLKGAAMKAYGEEMLKIREKLKNSEK